MLHPLCPLTSTTELPDFLSLWDPDAFSQETLRAAPDETYEFRLDEPFLQRLATLNPVATTLFYEQLAEAIFTKLVGMPPSNRRRASRTVQLN